MESGFGNGKIGVQCERAERKNVLRRFVAVCVSCRIEKRKFLQ